MESTKYVPALVCWIAYLSAAASISLIFYFPVIKSSSLWNGFFADSVATCVIFFFSLNWSNSSIYDPFWCYIPVVISLAWIVSATDGGAPSARSIYVLFILVVWCLRYAIQWPWSGWLEGLTHEDWRYVNMAKMTGAGTPIYWMLSLVGSVATDTTAESPWCLMYSFF